MSLPAKKTETDTRLDRVLDLIIRYSKGEFSARETISEKGDELDALIIGMNTLGEELSAGTVPSGFETRMSEVLEGAVKITLGNYSYHVPVSETGDSLDALAVALNTLSEELLASGKTIRNYEARINGIMEKLLKYTMMDFSDKVDVTEKGDELDAVAIGLNTLTEELETHIHELKESEERFRLLVGNIKDYAIYMLDPTGHVMSWNQGAENITGYTEKEIIGKHISVFHTEDEIQNGDPDNNLKIAKEKGQYENESWRVRKDRSRFWANVVFSALYDDKGLLRGFAKITRDVTERKKAEEQLSKNNWLLTGISELNDDMRGEKSGEKLAQAIINKLVAYLNIQIGALYFSQDNSHLKFMAGYAFSKNYHDAEKIIKYGEGLVGQAALERKSITFHDVPDNYVKISSGIGQVSPKEILIVPFFYEGNVKGVVELASLTRITDLQLDFLGLVSENIGITVHSSQTREQMQILLEETQAQSEELESQQDELKQINEELTEQRNAIQASEEELRTQQEELEHKNNELERKTGELENQNYNVKIQNQELENARIDIEEKTKQIEISSKYKSEFLANMSHELRTPLNSLLILSKDLSENKKGNLTSDQEESAEIIYKSGKDLLALINEVLDLSKIEAGKMTLNIDKLDIKNFAAQLKQNFKHHTDQKGLTLDVAVLEDAPVYITTDQQRLDQIMKNLISNAIKFTESGGITITIGRKSDDMLAIMVSDTGVGIPEEKQSIIFEAFQQADGGTARKYGGTGLGLSISRELAKLLGAEIKLTSKVNQGSSFTLVVPLKISVEETVKTPPPPLEERPAIAAFEENNEFINYPTIADDRDKIKEDDQVVLVIEDDLKFAGILQKQAHERNFKCISASSGEDGLLMAEKYKPHAIILDRTLPGINGDTVLTALKINPDLRHIPVHIMSVRERSLDMIKEGAVEYLIKPVDKQQLDGAFSRIENFIKRKMKNLLIIEDDENSRTAIKKLIGNGDVKCLEAATGKEALQILKENHIDCIILDLGLPDMSGFDIIRKLEEIKDYELPPIIVNTGREISKEENDELQKFAQSIIIKGIKSEDRLLDETALFLHRTISKLPPVKQQIIMDLYNKEAIYQNKKILLVDDDMRNIFALSKVLKERGVHIIKAENGVLALEMLSKNPNIDMVLMDIMMPEMDGYEAMRRIRQQEQFNHLPIIALTAKAMKEDRQKCIDAGANDYIAKPVDLERLLSLMRVWLNK